MRKTICLFFFATLFCTACTPTAEPTPDSRVVAVKQLATVEIPPTPDRAEREATRRALPTTPTAIPPTVTPSNTPYIGVFLGTPGGDDSSSSIPFVDAVIPTVQQASSECPIPFDEAFGTGWRSNSSVARRVGCALQQRFGFAGNVQVFERGVMYHRADTNEVWAVQPGSGGTGQFWYVNQPAAMSMEGLIPPPGLRTPGNAFGAVWITNTEVNTALGFATTPEQTADLNLQRFDGGSLLLDVTVGQVFLLFDDGDAFGPY